MLLRGWLDAGRAESGVARLAEGAGAITGACAGRRIGLPGWSQHVRVPWFADDSTGAAGSRG